MSLSGPSRSSLDAERALLAGVLLSNEQFASVSDELQVWHFDSAQHRYLWLALCALNADGSPMDLPLMRNELERQGKLEQAGGIEYIASLIDGHGRTANVKYYADVIKKHAARRAIGVEAERISIAARNGHSDTELQQALGDHLRLIGECAAEFDGTAKLSPVDLYSEAVVPRRPEFTVANLIRRYGLHLLWAEPSGGKTWTLLRWVHELLFDTGCGRLTGHPELWINRRYERVLWIATEEDAETLRHKADQVSRGMGIDPGQLRTRLKYLFAATHGRRITLDDLPGILAAEPYDCIVLDSLTGLRPKTVNGERVRWDVDNDAANEMCLRLRALATEHKVAIVLVHHTGRETSKGYRGPTDWWASADVMLGLVPDGGRTKVMVEKNRDGKRLAPFYLTPAWEGDSYTLEYDGSAVAVKLSPTADKLRVYFNGVTQARQDDAFKAVGCAASTGKDAVKALLAAGLLRDTGNVLDRSPILAAAQVTEATGSDGGSDGAKKAAVTQ